MFGWVKNYFVLLGALLLLVNCAPVGPTGETRLVNRQEMLVVAMFVVTMLLSRHPSKM